MTAECLFSKSDPYRGSVKIDGIACNGGGIGLVPTNATSSNGEAGDGILFTPDDAGRASQAGCAAGFREARGWVILKPGSSSSRRRRVASQGAPFVFQQAHHQEVAPLAVVAHGLAQHAFVPVALARAVGVLWLGWRGEGSARRTAADRGEGGGHLRQ